MVGAVLVGDICVTFDSNDRRDMLKKIHEVGPHMACGFSGSVRLGFEMVDSLQAFVAGSPWGDCPPTGRVVFKWWRKARRLWNQQPDETQKLGCSLIIAGAQPRKGFINYNSAFRLRAPLFEPERIRREPLSIGSGNAVDAYRELLRQAPDWWAREYNKRPGLMLGTSGPLELFAAVVRDKIDTHPTAGVSPHLHLCLVRHKDIIWDTNDVITASGRWVMPTVATDWNSFSTMASQSGCAADAAIA